jgi:uncharacterized membrane protein
MLLPPGPNPVSGWPDCVRKEIARKDARIEQLQAIVTEYT